MFAGVYFSFFRRIRRLTKGPFRTFLFAFLLFVLVRGIADTERFDLSLPMWAFVMFSLLIEQARTMREETTELSAVVPVPFGNDSSPSLGLQ